MGVWRSALLGMLLLGAVVAALGLRVHAPPPALPAEALVAPRPPVAPLALPRAARVIVFAPHPDDETVGVGGLLARLTHRGTPVRVVFLTNGDGYPRAVQEGFDTQKPTDADFVAFGELRQREALAATRRLGIARRDVRFLGFPDGGLAELWRAHWLRTRPYTSPYTKEDSPPYGTAVNANVDYDGQDLTTIIARELREFRPSVVIMPHPYDRHDDHLHGSYFVTEAVSGLVDRGLLPAPTIVTYLVHYPSWPATRAPEMDRMLSISELADTHWLGIDLTPAELAAKRAALDQYKSQLEVMDGFLHHFLCRDELYARVDGKVLARIALVH